MPRRLLSTLSLPLLMLIAPTTGYAESGHGAVAPNSGHRTTLASAAVHTTSDAALSAEGHGGAQWGYAAPNDPSVWAELSDEFRACSIGREQSPIDIRESDLLGAPFEPVGMHWLPFKPSFVNNGHTLQVNANDDAGYAELGGTRYDLLQFHFHAQSEHTVNGQHAPMEVHFVHRNDLGELLVLGAMIEGGVENVAIKTLWSQVPKPGNERVIDAMIDPLSLVPRDHSSYRYAGSLTTPPCSEIVTWNVFVEPVFVSGAQLSAFTKHYDDNARPVQDVGRRFVLTDAQH